MTTTEAAKALRTLNTRGVKGDFVISEQHVLTGAHPRGMLTEEQYAPHLAAADARTLDYMTWGRFPVTPAALAYTVVVDGAPVAWLQYDGLVRVIDGPLGSPTRHTIRRLAREYLGQDPAVQQRLADQRADIDRMSAEAFPGVIGAFRRHAAPGSKMNDYPAGMTVRDYDHKYRTPREPQTPGNSYAWNHPPNPTRELTDAERKTWAEKAEQYVRGVPLQVPRGLPGLGIQDLVGVEPGDPGRR
ncbi:hypothetical protein [Streptomyces sp. Midd1]|uniref:hypothetical protein n=1 Tax=Streptomyces sp. Midd3 TaxID=3161191 RepID=UPI0034DB015E